MCENREKFGLVACGYTLGKGLDKQLVIIFFRLSNPAFVSVYLPQFHLFAHREIHSGQQFGLVGLVQ